MEPITFNSSIWRNLEAILSTVMEINDIPKVKEECGPSLEVVILAIQQVQNRLANRDRIFPNNNK